MDKLALITVINMFVKTNFTKQQIADLSVVGIDFVGKWEKELKLLLLHWLKLNP